MTRFRIIPLSKNYADRIRKTMTDDFRRPVIEQVATGLGPCRVSLKVFNRGVDKRLLFTHSPFEVDNAYDQPGPVFINADDIEEYADVHRFPPEIKAEKESIPLTLVGYNSDQMMALTQLVGDDDIDELIPKIFDERPDIAFLHARNARACCYVCKIVRA